MIRPPAGPLRLGMGAALIVNILDGTLWAAILVAVGLALLLVARKTEW